MSRMLRFEAAALAIGLAVALWRAQPDWWIVVAVLILPDLSMVGYAGGAKIGARVYNSAHSYIAPIILAMGAAYFGASIWLTVAGLWALHIAVDRALGYGLKSDEGFTQTHLGRIGK